MRWEIKLAGLIFVSWLLIASTSVDTQPKKRELHQNDLICPERFYASAGEDVTLDCHIESQHDVTEDSVEWKFGSDTVLVYRSKNISPDDQAERLKGRAEQDSTWNPAEGKLAVKIKSFRTTDAGTYTCSVGKGRDKVSCRIEVNLKQPDNQGSPIRSKAEEPRTDPVVTLVLATFALLYSLCH